MARKTRINLSHAVYHIMCRSNMKDYLFRIDADRRRFLYYLEKYAFIFDFRIHAFCLMDTHVHFLAESRNPNLSEFMRRLLISYTLSYHRRHHSRGHVFAGRFRSLVVEHGDYMLAASRYIHLNPVDAGLCEEAEQFKWSSMKYYLKPKSAPNWLCTSEILGWFGNNPQKYKLFIHEGLNEELKPFVWAQRFIGGKAFSKRIRARLDQGNDQKPGDYHMKFAEDLLKKCCRKMNCTPEEFRKEKHPTRRRRNILKDMVGLLRAETDWSYRRIAEHLGISLIYAQKLERLARENKYK